MPYKDPEQYRAYQAAYRAAHTDDSRQYQKAYREEHIDSLKEYDRQRYITDGEVIRARNRAAYRTYLEKRQAYRIAYYQANRAKVKAAADRWKQSHPDKIRAYKRAWKRRNPESDRAYRRNRNARLRGATTTRLTAADWEAIKAQYRNRCVYCRKRGKLTQDHVIPVSKGGAHTMGNVVPACASCNSRKGNRAVLRPVQGAML